MKIINLIITAALSLFVIGLALQLSDIKTSSNGSQYYSAKTIPVAFITGTLVLFCIIFLKDMFMYRQDIDEETKGGAKALLLPRRLIFMGTTLAYVLTFDSVGFVISSVIFLFVTAVLLGGKWSKRNIHIDSGVLSNCGHCLRCCHLRVREFSAPT